MNPVQKETMNHGTPELNFAIYDHTRPNSNIGPHWHPEYEIDYAYKGPVSYLINGISYTIQSGEILFINKNLIHSNAVPLGPNRRYVSIVFGEQFIFPNLMDSLYQMYLLPLQKQHKCFPTVITKETDYGKKIIGHVEEMLQDYFEKGVAYELSLRTHLMSIFYIAISQNIFVDSDLKENAYTFVVRNALSTIHKNYMNPISIQILSSGLGVTPEYFCRIFKAAVGKRPLEYINACRIAQARVFLSQTQESVTTIAAKCGFDDMNYFSRCFKKIQGVTPTEYRKSLFKHTEENCMEQKGALAESQEISP